ncbi:MAG: hypothetical protein ACHQ0J_08610, partial [Candidatus Dormibacterales bacterium]
SGPGPLTRLVDILGTAAGDVKRVSREWHRDGPRPHTRPERGAVVPAPASDLGWARQEPVRSLRY